MKVGILAGGKGTRISEETQIKPKPMVEIGGKPILWHIMRHYAHYGFNDFAIALGYLGDSIKKYIVDYSQFNSDLHVDMRSGAVARGERVGEQWTVDLVDTGQETMTGGRIKRLQPFLGDDTFMLTWGDGVSDIDLHKLLAFHKQHGKLATLTAVRPPARYGRFTREGDAIVEFSNAPQATDGWINGAFFVLEPQVFDYIEGDDTMWEREPMERLAADGQLMAYRHDSFWQCMDTLREKHLLETLWQTTRPWASWERAATP